MRVCPRCKSVYASKTQFCGIDGERLVTATTDPLIGELLGRYNVEQKIGQGASGGVYRAIHTELGAEFAIKVLLGELGSDEEVVGRFRREAKAASRIRSANVVSVVDVGTTEAGLTYLVMEYAAGRPLDRVIKEEAPFPPPRAGRILRDVAAGLSVAHGLGFVHRDIKPSNIFVASEGGREVAKILDFGIVRVEDSAEGATKLTQDGQVIGTPAYMAPEQWNKSSVGPPADLYSLGIVLIEMLTGAKPFTGGSMIEVLGKHLHEPPPKLPVSAGLEHLAYRLVAKTPEGRPANAQQVVIEAEEILAQLSMEMLGSRPTSFPSMQIYGRPADTASMRGPQDPMSSSGPITHGRGTPPPPLVDATSHAEAAMSETMGAARTLSGAALSRGIQQGQRRRTVGMAVGAALLVAAGGVVAIGVTRPGSGGAASDMPKVEAPALRPIAELERALDERLRARGLERADLENLPTIAPMATRWRAMVGGGDVEGANGFAGELTAAVGGAPIPAALVREKLHRLDSRVAEVAKALPDAEGGALEQRYLELYKAVSEHPEGGFGDLAKKVAAFSAELDRRHAELPPADPEE